MVAPIDAATQVIYDSAKGPVFSFVAGNVLDIAGASATEIQAMRWNGAVVRVIAGTWGSAGRYAVEFYFQGDTLLFTYESFEFIAEAAPPGQWQNFRKLPAWERRVYWRDRAAAFVEASGCPARMDPGETARLLRSAASVKTMMTSR